MQDIRQAVVVANDEIESDVWWGEHGIDVGLWADPAPYVPPTLELVDLKPQTEEVLR